jgi:hypothetical protein
MKKALPALAAFTLIVAAGLLNGMWTNRWSVSRELEAAEARVKDVPPTFGDWEGHDLNLDPATMAEIGIDAFVYRGYVRRGSDGKDWAQILLVCGRAGPVCVHTPDVCFPSAGFRMGDKKQVAIGAGRGKRAEFETATFVRKGGPGAAMPLRVSWAWSADGAWQAPDNPRWTFGRRPALYKLYIIQPAAGPSAGKDAGPEFVQDLLTELDRRLFAGR